MLTPELITYAPTPARRVETFDFRLRKIMTEQQWTSTALSTRVRMNRSCFSRLYNGKVKPNFWTLCELAHALNVSIDWLVGFTDEMRPLIPEQ